jgi:DNA-binding MurR/RpiR family transcriptional regulator
MTGAETAAELISDHYGTLSAGHRKLADYILDNPHDAALMTLEGLAAASGVSVATANRLGSRLGLSGHPELKARLRQGLQDALRPTEQSVDALRIGGFARAAPWTRSIEEDVRRIHGIRANGGDSAFARASDLIAKARRLLLVGFGSSAFVAQYAAFNFATLRDDCHAITDSSGVEGAFRNAIGAGPQDVAIQLAFARYSEAGTRMANRLREAGVQIVAISDAADSPIALLAAASFVVERKSGFVLTGGGAGAVAIVEALLHGTSAAIGIEEVQRRAARLTSMLDTAIVPTERSA